MIVANIMIELSSDADADIAKFNVQAKLENAPEVERAVVDEDTDRFDIASTVAILAAAVVLVDHGAKLVESVTKLIKTTQTLLKEGTALKSAVIEIAGIKIDPNADDTEIRAAVAKIMDEV